MSNIDDKEITVDNEMHQNTSKLEEDPYDVSNNNSPVKKRSSQRL